MDKNEDHTGSINNIEEPEENEIDLNEGSLLKEEAMDLKTESTVDSEDSPAKK